MALFQPKIWTGGTNQVVGQQYDVARDGRFLIDVTVDDGPSSPITLIQNWHPEAKK